MKHGRLVGLVLVVALVAACGVKKEEHAGIVAQLAECQAEGERWESLYQESVEERRMALDQALEILPAAHADLRESIDVRLDEVTAALDQTLKVEVQETVYELAEAMAAGYNTLQQENRQLEAQLSESRALIETVLERTDTIEATTGSIEERVGVERDTFLAARQGLLLEIGEVESYLRDWKYSYIDCKGCEERLRINNRERDALSQLNDEIVARLAAVRAEITEVGELPEVMAPEMAEEMPAEVPE